MKLPKKLLLFSLLVGVLLAFVYGFGLKATSPQTNSDFKLWFLNVGEGDSILIDDKGYQILVDGGPSDAVLGELTKALKLDKEINLVIVTHNDADHLKGLVSVLQNYKIDKIWLTGATHDSATYRQFEDLLASKKIPTEKVKLGSQINVNDLTGDVLYPLTTPVGSDAGNTSIIVSRWQYFDNSFLLTSDMEADQESQLLAQNLIKPTKILKVAHHGSSGSSTENFVKALAPQLAVISVGKNSYGHPTAVVIDKLKYFGATVLRTDLDKTIEVDMTKTGFSYKTGI